MLTRLENVMSDDSIERNVAHLRANIDRLAKPFVHNVRVHNQLIRVETNSRDQILCIDDYFKPFVSKGARKSEPLRSTTVQIVADTGLYGWCMRHYRTGERDRIVSHHPDTSYNVYRRDRETAFLALTGYLHLIIHFDVDHYIVLHPQDTDPERSKPGLRLIRELVVSDIEAEGGVTVHASAAALGARGLLFVGAKGAGKTTCAIAIAFEDRGRMLSGDRTVVAHQGTRCLAYAWPMAINVGWGALTKINHVSLGDLSTSARNSYFDTYGIGADVTFDPENRKLALTPLEFAQKLKVQFNLKSKLEAVCFPVIDNSVANDAELFQLERNAALSRLKAETRVGEQAGHGYGLVARTNAFSGGQGFIDPLLEAVVDAVPSFELRVSLRGLTRFLSREARLSEVIFEGACSARS